MPEGKFILTQLRHWPHPTANALDASSYAFVYRSATYVAAARSRGSLSFLIAHMEIMLEKSCVLNYTILKTNDFVLL